jgi:hypothetical protein
MLTLKKFDKIRTKTRMGKGKAVLWSGFHNKERTDGWEKKEIVGNSERRSGIGG